MNDSEMENEWRDRFKSNFSENQLNRRSTIQLASGVQVIYHTLIGLTAVAKQNVEKFEKDSENFYKLDGDLKEAADVKESTAINARTFIAENPDYAIEHFELSSSDKISITELAPKIFR